MQPVTIVSAALAVLIALPFGAPLSVPPGDIALLLSRYHFMRLEPKLVTAHQDEVWGLFDVEALYQPTGRPVRFDLFIRWTMQDGKIVAHQCLFDTASVLMQQGDMVAA